MNNLLCQAQLLKLQLRALESHLLLQAAEEVTNFPKTGDNKKVSLQNSQWQLFPVEFAQDIKENWPDIWKAGGNIKGNDQFAALSPIAKHGGAAKTTAEEEAVRLREAWVARHFQDNRLAGVVAQIKWLAVGTLGIDGMKKVINEQKDKIRDRQKT